MVSAIAMSVCGMDGQSSGRRACLVVCHSHCCGSCYRLCFCLRLCACLSLCHPACLEAATADEGCDCDCAAWRVPY